MISLSLVAVRRQLIECIGRLDSINTRRIVIEPTIKNNKGQKSLVAFLQSYMISITDFAISKRRNDFSLAYVDIIGLRRKALFASGYESTIRLMQAYYHLLKTEPKLNQELEDLLIG